MVERSFNCQHHLRGRDHRTGAGNHGTAPSDPAQKSVYHELVCMPTLVRLNFHSETESDRANSVPAAAVIQLVFFHRESKDLPTQNDSTLGFWRSAICNQIVQCLAIVTTCLPYTKIFMEGFESGLIRVDDGRRRAENTSKGYSGRQYQLMDVSRSSEGKQTPPDKSINVSTSWEISVEPAKRVQPA